VRPEPNSSKHQQWCIITGGEGHLPASTHRLCDVCAEETPQQSCLHGRLTGCCADVGRPSHRLDVSSSKSSGRVSALVERTVCFNLGASTWCSFCADAGCLVRVMVLLACRHSQPQQSAQAPHALVAYPAQSSQVTPAKEAASEVTVAPHLLHCVEALPSCPRTCSRRTAATGDATLSSHLVGVQASQ
jgi:hypothetical protein